MLRGLPYGFLILAALFIAALAPLTRYTNAAASQYTYHVVRSFSSLLFGLTALATTADGGLWQAIGSAKDRPWFLCFGISQWFFLWGYVHAMQAMSGAQWATVHYCTYPFFATFIALAAYGERPQWGYFTYTCCRNITVIILMMADSIGGDGHGSIATGVGFVMITAFSNGNVTAILRNLKGVSPLVPLVWSDALNTLLWIPPGILGTRVPFLWPDVNGLGHVNLTHNLHFPHLVWAGLVVTGMLGAGGIVSTGFALRQLGTAYVAVFAAPLAIVFSVLADVASGKAPTLPAVAGALIFCTCSVLEWYLQVLPQGAEPKDASIEEGCEPGSDERQRLLGQEREPSSGS